MAERPKKLTVELAKSTIRWLDSHPDELACVESFVAMMVEELAANDGKGNRPGWLTMDRKTAIAEVHWHASKLAVAAKESDADHQEHDDLVIALNNVSRVREFAADTANCALMVLDCMGVLNVPQPTDPTPPYEQLQQAGQDTPMGGNDG